jgi:hypothetical protein
LIFLDVWDVIAIIDLLPLILMMFFFFSPGVDACAAL